MKMKINPKQIVLSPELLNAIDAARAKYSMNRSDFIRYAVVNQCAKDDVILPAPVDAKLVPVVEVQK
jgi:metal-responsive CopG/Arc/MetJ family transcriptional regulator